VWIGQRTVQSGGTGTSSLAKQLVRTLLWYILGTTPPLCTLEHQTLLFNELCCCPCVCACRSKNRFPTPLDATTQDDVYVGRIRRDISRQDNKGLELFVCGDQIKKGEQQQPRQGLGNGRVLRLILWVCLGLSTYPWDRFQCSETTDYDVPLGHGPTLVFAK
jgi:hypothetical protein